MRRRRNPDSKTMKQIGGAIAGYFAGGIASDEVAASLPAGVNKNMIQLAGAVAGFFIAPEVLK